MKKMVRLLVGLAFVLPDLKRLRSCLLELQFAYRSRLRALGMKLTPLGLEILHYSLTHHWEGPRPLIQ